MKIQATNVSEDRNYRIFKKHFLQKNTIFYGFYEYQKFVLKSIILQNANTIY